MKARPIAVVCASNMNRSMEAHYQLKLRNFNVSSYGTGSQVKLPGPAADKPNVYAFGTPYQEIRDDLLKKDERLYTANGLLSMLARNINVKEAPQRWQESTESRFDLVITFEERVFDAVVEDMQNRDADTDAGGDRPVHIFNLDVPDNHESSVVGSRHMLKLLHRLDQVEDWEDEVESVIEQFETDSGVQVLHTIAF